MIVVMMMMRGTGGLRTGFIEEMMMKSQTLLIRSLAHDEDGDDVRHRRIEDRHYRRDLDDKAIGP